ncbi:MAG: SPOR domain-containing protein [Chlorobi bacterium]|nr:SPOR domain-containing protein [Chlorobiota bacterium]
MNYNTPKYKNILPISLIILVIATAWTLPKIINDFDFGNLKNKDYYTTLFNETQQNELAFADEQYLKGKTEFVKAEKLYKKADGYEKIAKSSGKSSSKAKRYTKKGVKKSLKAYKYFFIASDKKFHIYSDRLKNMNNDNSKKHLKAEELGINAREKYLEGIELKNQAKSFSGKEKVSKLEEAFSKHLEAIHMQETAFGIFMNDPEVQYNKTKDEVVSNNNSNNENNYTNNNTDEVIKYEPKKNLNLYKSKEEFIVSKLNMTAADKSLLEDAHDKRAYAETLMKETDDDYAKIADIRKQAANADSDYDRNLKNKMAAGLEDVLFDKMIKAANMFYEADKTKYEVYDKYLPEARNSKDFKEGRKHEANALSLHSYAKKIYNKANFYSGHKSNKYIQLMDAVQTELSAIQEQENAFSIYFEQETTPLDELVEENKPITIKPGKTNDNSKKKLTYNYNGSYVYSVENPKPRPLIHKKGIIFKVQLGLFKNLLPLKQYGKYSPISYDTYKNNPYKRFMLGEYRSYKAAEYVLNQVISEGLKDPFIVAYEDGVRKTATYGMSKIIRDSRFEKIEKQELAKLKGATNEYSENKTSTGKTNDNSNIEDNSNIADNVDISNTNTTIKNINTIKGVSYSVQLGNFSTKKSANDFKGANPIYYSKNGTTYKYMSGAYKTYNEAKNKKNKLTANGYEGLFIIAHNNGTKISLDQAKNLSNNNSVVRSENNTKDNIYFTVQISAYSHKLNETEMAQYAPITQKYNIDINKVDGSLYLYTVGKYSTYKKAASVKKDIKNMGFDGFVIAFKNGVRISAQEAIEILKNK